MWNRFKTIRSHGNEISQFAYEAMSKLISRNRSQLTCDQVQGSPQPKDAGSGTTKENAMRKLLMLSFWGAILLLSGAPLAAQNSVDVLGGGPQPANTVGCAVLPNCIPAVWSTTSNAGTDISAPIAASFAAASSGEAAPTDFPTATSG